VQRPKPKVVERSEAQVAEGEAGPSKAGIMRSKAQIAEGEAGSSKSKDVAPTTLQVKKVKVVPKPWRAPEARMY
jgi:hypothetical protein